MSKHTGRWLIAIITLSVLLRVAVALLMGDTVPAGKDEYSYSTLAARLATGFGFTFPEGWYPFTAPDTPTSHWSFLYTGFVAAVYAIAGPHPLAARLLQALIAGLLMPWLTFRLTHRILNRRPGANPSTVQLTPLLAAVFAAVYAYFVLYAAMVQTEAFFVCAVLWSLERGMALEESLREAAAGRRVCLIAFSLGASMGVAALLRQSILPWFGVMFAHLLYSGWRGTRTDARLAPRRALAALLMAGAVTVACILPVTVRNYRVYGQFLLLNSNAGYAMYSAQHPLHGTSFQEYAAAPLPADLVDQGLNEAQWDKELMRQGIGFVLAEPGRYLLLSLSRVPDYFEFWPTADSSTLFNLGRTVSFGIFLPFMVWGVFLAARRYGSRLTLLYLFMGVYSVLHIFTWAMSRYRLPVDAVALPFAAIAFHTLADRITGRMHWLRPLHPRRTPLWLTDRFTAISSRAERERLRK